MRNDAMGSGNSKKPRADAGENVKSRVIGIVKKGDWKKFYEPVDNGTLGSGMTGSVFVVTHKKTGKKFACKPLKKVMGNKQMVETLYREISLLAQLDHPNIMKIVEGYENMGNVTTIMELLDGGSLFKNLSQSTKAGRYTEKRAAELFVQMVRAVKFVHSNGIAHRDLKLENFVFESKAKDAPLKLIDFGLGQKYRQKDKVMKMKNVVGTVYYMAPEIAMLMLAGDGAWEKNQSYTNKVDIWSLGVLLFMLLTGAAPFRGMSQSHYHYLKNAARGKISFAQSVWDRIPLAKDLVQKMMQVKATARLPLDQVLKHKWLESAMQANDTAENKELTQNLVENFAEIGKINKIKRVTAQIAAFTIAPDVIAGLRSAFMQLDKNDSGTISFEEFKEAMKTTGMNDHDAATLFTNMDIDETGTIEYSEFISAAMLVTKSVAQVDMIEAFNKMDTDADGTVENEDLLKILQGVVSEQEAQDLIKEMEQMAGGNKDGKISRQEFMATMQQHASANASADSKTADSKS